MKAAVLCNGPSRNAFTSREGYDFIMGCNIPWTKVDATCILDTLVISKWNVDHSLIDVPIYCSGKAWNTACQLDKPFFEQFFKELISCGDYYDSSGHVAVKTVIDMGYKEIDIYGCDAYFKRSVESYTSQFVEIDTGPNSAMRKVERAVGWKVHWSQMINNHRDVKLNFIKGI